MSRYKEIHYMVALSKTPSILDHICVNELERLPEIGF
jgi:hypothetical protein